MINQSPSLGSRLCLAKSSNLREADLVSKCSGTLECTLEFLTAAFFSPSLFSFGSAVGRRLTATIAPGPLDLSEAAKLKEVEFRYAGRNIQRLTTTLRTAKSTSLQTIAITIPHSVTPVNLEWETIRGEWQATSCWTNCGPHVRFAQRSHTKRIGYRKVLKSLFQVCYRSSRVRGSSTGSECVVDDPNGNVIDTVDIALERRMCAVFAQSLGSLILGDGFGAGALRNRWALKMGQREQELV